MCVGGGGNKAKRTNEFGRKKQQNGNMASWFDANIKIISWKRKHFFNFPPTFSSKIAVF
jgi:hypothetical protein